MFAELCGVVLTICLSSPTGSPTAGTTAPFRVFELELPEDVARLHWGRRQPGRRRDIFGISPWQVRIWRHGETGFPETPDEAVSLPEEPSLVDCGDLTGDAGEEIVLLNRRGVFVDTGSQNAPAETGGADTDRAEPFQRLLPVSGIPVVLESFPVAATHDLTGDGRPDLIVPVRDGYRVFLRRDDGLEESIFLQGEHGVTVDPGGPELIDPLQSRVRVPRMETQDLNGDGRVDIVSRLDEKIRCYLQGPAGFSEEPSYVLDLTRFSGTSSSQGKAGRQRELRSGSSAQVYEEDIDGDGVQDYLVGHGQILRLYFGTPDGVDFSRPYRMFKLSSELQGLGSFDLNGDGRLDLVALKFEVPGLPKLLAAYFVSMSLDFEVLGYGNEGGRRFARRPNYRARFTLSFPPLRRIVEDFEVLADRFLEAATKRRRFAAGDMDGDGRPDSVFLDDDRVLRIFIGRAGDPDPSRLRIGQALFNMKKTSWSLEELLDFVAAVSHDAARQAVSDRKPDIEVALEGPAPDPERLELNVVDLNGDGKGDVVVRWNATRLRVLLSAE